MEIIEFMKKLRGEGYAVILWTPEELKGMDSVAMEDLSISYGHDLIDMIKEDAVALLQSLGLNVDINEPPFTPLNRVIAQDPSSGTLVPAGSTVTITII